MDSRVGESFYLFFLFDSPASLNNSPRLWRLVQTLMREKSICKKNEWKTMIKKGKSTRQIKVGALQRQSNIRWRISCLKLGWIMGGLGEWDAEEGEEDMEITTQIFRYKRSHFLHQHWHKWAKRIIQLVWSRAFIRATHKKYAFNQNSYGILFSMGVIEWLIISMHSTVSPTWYAIIVVIIKHSDQIKSLRRVSTLMGHILMYYI